MKKRIISKKVSALFLAMTLGLSVMPIYPVYASTSIDGPNILDLNDDKNIFKASYSVPVPTNGEVSWSIESAVEGAVLLSSTGEKNSMVDVFIFKDEITQSRITLKARADNKDYFKEIELEKDAATTLHHAELVAQTNSQSLIASDDFSFTSQYYLPANKQQVTHVYDLSIYDNNFNNVVSDFTVEKKSLSPGVSISKEDKTVMISIDRGEMINQKETAVFTIKGVTTTDINFSITITFRINAEGVVGEPSGKFSIDLKLDKESPFVVLNDSTQTFNVETTIMNYDQVIPTSDVTYILSSSQNSFASVSKEGLVTIPPNTPEGRYKVTAKYKDAEEFLYFYVVNKDKTYTELQFKDIGYQYDFSKDIDEFITISPTYTNELIQFYVEPETSGIEINYNESLQEYTLKLNDAIVPGRYIIGAENVLVNDLILDVKDPSVTPEDFYDIELNLDRTAISIPLGNEDKYTLNASTFELGILKELPVTYTISPQTEGVQIEGNKLVVYPVAIEDTYTLQAALTKYPQVKTSVYLDILDESIPDTANYKIEAYVETDDTNNIDIPKSGHINIPIQHKVKKGQNTVKEEVIFELNTSSQDVSIENGILRIGSNAKDGLYEYSVYLKNNPDVKVKQTFGLNTTTSAEVIEPSIDLGVAVLKIPQDGAEKFYYTKDILVNEITDLSRPHKITVFPEDSGVSVLFDEDAIRVESTAKAGYYTLVLEMIDGSGKLVQDRFLLTSDTSNTDPLAKTITIHSPAQFYINPDMDRTYQLSATVQEGHTTIDEPIIWSISGNSDITISQDGELLIKKTAKDQELTITATLKSDSSVKTSKIISAKVKDSDSTDKTEMTITLNVENSYKINHDIDTTYQLSATIKEGATVVNEPITWSILNNQDIELDQNGLLTVKKTAPNQTVSIKATLDSDESVFAIKSVQFNETSEDVDNGDNGDNNNGNNNGDNNNGDNNNGNNNGDNNNGSNNGNNNGGNGDIDKDTKSIELTIPDKFNIPEFGKSTYHLTANVKQGSSIIDETIVWSLDEKLEGVELTKEGVLIIDSSVKEQVVTIIATLKSDKKVSTYKDVVLKGIINTDDVPASIVLKGFDNDFNTSGDRELVLDNYSGNIRKITAHTYDDEGNEIKGAEVIVELGGHQSGLKIEKGENLNEYYIFINGAYDDIYFDLVAYTDGSNSNRIYVPAVAHKPRFLTTSLKFSKKDFSHRGNVEVTAKVTNNSSSSEDITLIVTTYKNGKLIDLSETPGSLKSGKSITLSKAIDLPYDIEGMEIRAFLVRGKDALTSSQILAKTIKINK